MYTLEDVYKTFPSGCTEDYKILRAFEMGKQATDKRIAELEKENTELKEELKQWKDGIALKDEEIGCIETDFNTFKSKAKEIIKNLMAFAEMDDREYEKEYKQAEQFLSEVEK